MHALQKRLLARLRSLDVRRGDISLGMIFALAAAAIIIAYGASRGVALINTAMATMASNSVSTIGSEMKDYYVSNGTYPATVTALVPNYLGSVPVDPASPFNNNPYTITAYTPASGGAQSFVITDSIAHPQYTLNALRKFPGQDTSPTQTCGAAGGCTQFVYDPRFGLMGQ